MDSKLQRLVLDYQTVVSRRFTQLRTELGFAAPESDVAWACNDLEQRGRLSDGALYFKHGYGCAIKGATDSVDFDFGWFRCVEPLGVCGGLKEGLRLRVQRRDRGCNHTFGS